MPQWSACTLQMQIVRLNKKKKKIIYPSHAWADGTLQPQELMGPQSASAGRRLNYTGWALGISLVYKNDVQECLTLIREVGLCAFICSVSPPPSPLSWLIIAAIGPLSPSLCRQRWDGTEEDFFFLNELFTGVYSSSPRGCCSYGIGKGWRGRKGEGWEESGRGHQAHCPSPLPLHCSPWLPSAPLN